LRLYMPTATQDQIADGTFLNSAGYTRTPTPGTRTNADEQVATEFTFAPGAYGEPTGSFTPEGPYVGNGFGFYNNYFAEVVAGGPVPVSVGPVTIDIFPFLFQDLFDAFQRGDILIEYDGYEEGQLDSMALNDEVDDGGANRGARSFFEQVLDDAVGPRREPYTAEEREEDQLRRQIRFSRAAGKGGLTFYVFDPGTNEYSSFRVFGNPRTATAAAQ